MPRIVAFLGYYPFEPPPAGFAHQLKAARISAGLTRLQLAARLGVHPGTVAEWERGEVQPLESSSRRLRAVLGLSGGQTASLLHVAQRKPPN